MFAASIFENSIVTVFGQGRGLGRTDGRADE